MTMRTHVNFQIVSVIIFTFYFNFSKKIRDYQSTFIIFSLQQKSFWCPHKSVQTSTESFPRILHNLLWKFLILLSWIYSPELHVFLFFCSFPVNFSLFFFFTYILYIQIYDIYTYICYVYMICVTHIYHNVYIIYKYS